MFTIDLRVMRRASRDLIRHGLDVDDVGQIPLPDTGRSDCATQQGLERVTTEAIGLADHLRHLGDAVDDFVSSWTVLDGDVGLSFDLLHHSGLS